MFQNNLEHLALKALGPYYSLYIEIRPGQPLISSGPYRLVRHPCFLSSILEPIALCLIAHAWITLVTAVPIYILLYVLRLRFEERHLMEHFGKSYLKYKSSVGALFPRIKSLNILQSRIVGMYEKGVRDAK